MSREVWALWKESRLSVLSEGDLGTGLKERPAFPRLEPMKPAYRGQPQMRRLSFMTTIGYYKTDTTGTTTTTCTTQDSMGNYLVRVQTATIYIGFVSSFSFIHNARMFSYTLSYRQFRRQIRDLHLTRQEHYVDNTNGQG